MISPCKLLIRQHVFAKEEFVEATMDYNWFSPNQCFGIHHVVIILLACACHVYVFKKNLEKKYYRITCNHSSCCGHELVIFLQTAFVGSLCSEKKEANLRAEGVLEGRSKSHYKKSAKSQITSLQSTTLETFII